MDNSAIGQRININALYPTRYLFLFAVEVERLPLAVRQRDQQQRTIHEGCILVDLRTVTSACRVEGSTTVLPMGRVHLFFLERTPLLQGRGPERSIIVHDTQRGAFSCSSSNG